MSALFATQGITLWDMVRKGRDNIRSFMASRPPALSSRVLKQSLFVLLFIRIVILSSVVGSELLLITRSLLRNAESAHQGLSVGLVLGIYAISFVNLVAIKKYPKLTIVGILQIVTDIILSSLALIFTGSIVSIVLYLLVIVSAALIIGAYGALLAAAGSAMSYLAISSGFLIDPPQSMVSQNTFELLTVYFGLIIVGLTSGYLSRQLELAGISAERSKQDLSILAELQDRLINDLSEGIITLDRELTILRANDAVVDILGIRSQQLENTIGKPFKDFLSLIGLVESAEEVSRNVYQEGTGDLHLVIAKSKQAVNNQSLSRSQDEAIPVPETINRTISYRVRSISNSSGEHCGYLFLLSDVSHLRLIENRLSLHERMTRLLAIEQDTPEGASGSCPKVTIIGESLIMKRLFSLVSKLSDSTASVLIWGESGTGKELIARAIHCRGPRCNKPYVAVNCGAIPENLIESELFGHKKGSFTGAISDNIGLFRKAHGGTIFLDEIGELPLPLQTKLLRVLQERSVRAVGDSKDVVIDVRIVAATNKDLRREVQKGNFREDLYYRVNVVNLFVPPLRDRREDLQLLVSYFVQKFSKDMPDMPHISPQALELLMSYDFPGNIRELENVIERAIVLGGTAILPEHIAEGLAISPKIESSLSPDNQISGAAPNLSETQIKILPIDLELELSKLEQQYLSLALNSTNGMKKQAAELLGLNFRSFRYRLKKYGLASSAFEDFDQPID